DAALDGAEAVFLLSPTTPQLLEHERSVIESAVRAGRPRVVKLSALNATADSAVGFHRLHAGVVERLRVSGLPYTVLEPNDFMQNFLRQAASVHRDNKISASMGATLVSYVDTRDVAEVAVRVLTTAGHEGATYELTGPEALSRTQVAARISRLLGREVCYEDVPWPRMRETLRGDRLPEWLIDWMSQLHGDYRAGRAVRIAGGVQDVTGRPPRSIDDFLHDHRKAFEQGVGGRWP
ncbi:NmrA family NAD(P)-binding protein, partial [Mycobacterium sp. NPDC003449]